MYNILLLKDNICKTVNNVSCVLLPFRLFIEKLPKHHEYKSADIPEKKETMRVRCDFPLAGES